MNDGERDKLRDIVAACNAARSAEKAAAGFTSGHRVAGRRDAHAQRSQAWFAARHWIEAQARKALWEAGCDEFGPEVPHAAE